MRGHILGSIMELIQVDTRSLDYSSYGASEKVLEFMA